MIKIKRFFILFMVLFVLAAPFFAAEIHEAAKQGDLTKIKELLKKDPQSANAGDKNGKTPLHFAAQFNRVEAAALLIKNGADPNAKNVGGEAPVHYAAFLGRVEVMALLIEKGADINIADNAGNTALNHALNRGHKQLIDLLLEKGVKVKTHGPGASVMLHRAASLGCEKLVEILTAGGFDAAAENKSGGTLLHSAAAGGLTGLMEKLIKKGADVNRRNVYGAAPLHLAVSGGREKAVAILIQHGADINARTPDGFSPLNTAEKNGGKEIVKLLLAKGANRSGPVFPVLKGRYFGQKAPGKKPCMFAPGIVSTSDKNERDITFSPGFDEFYFSRDMKLHSGKKTGGKWTEPVTATFSGRYNDLEACFTPDGGKIFFISQRPQNSGGEPGAWEMWFVEKSAQGWSAAKSLGPAFKGCFYPTFTKGGAMYFTDSTNDLCRSQYVQGKFQAPEKLSDNINTAQAEYNSFIAPDESYLIFTSFGWGPGSGGGDLFISSRKAGGAWTKPKNLGPQVNSSAHDYCPSVTPDGKYFFFTSNRAGSEDIYWVDAAVLRSSE